jgi:apolipoprotein N-acyltransferase
MSYLVALVAGALLPLSLAPFGWWPLGFVSVAGWFWALRRTGQRAWLTGWLFGVGKYAAGASWVYVSIHVYGNAAPPLAAFLVLLFVGGLAGFTLVNGVAFARLRTGDVLTDAITFAVLFVTFEWTLTWVLTGFPWLFVGYAHLVTPLAGLAPVGGVMLVSLAVALGATLSVAAVVLWRAGARPRALAAAGLALLPWIAGAALSRIAWVEEGDARTVALVQGNIDQGVKWDPAESARITQTYLALSEQHWDADLLVWPEAAVTEFEHEAIDLLDGLDARGRQTGTAVVLGIPHAERLPDRRIELHNAVRVVGAGHGHYLKRRLVPFGEYVPLEGLLRGLIAFFDLPTSHMAPGPDGQPLLDIGGPRAAMAICYEVVYPDLVRADGANADVLMTVSNDTWFGASIGPLQHLEMAQMRALENGRWLLRATNNGVTAIVDARGRIRERIPQFEAGVLRGTWRSTHGTTPFTRYGELPLTACCGLLLLLAWLVRTPTRD